MPNNDTSPLLWIAITLLFVVLIAVATYKIRPLLNPDITAVATLDPDCDLRAGPCRVSFTSGGKVSFGIQPNDMPVVKPLEFQVSLDELEARKVEVDFTGVDMDMGFNRVQLKPSADGDFTGKGMLPVCVRYAMEWEARVLIHSDRGLLAAPFRFITVTPGVAPPGR